jgi:ATP-dependent Clp protease ATP-binding subunit ClpC
VFERYNGSARRALFFARFELSKIGGSAIETEHLLLGVLRAAKGIAAQICAAADVRYDAVRAEIQMRSEQLPTSVEVPFTAETKRILYGAAAESDRLGDGFVGAEHLLLSILVERDTAAARILAAKGIGVDAVRQTISESREL